MKSNNRSSLGRIFLCAWAVLAAVSALAQPAAGTTRAEQLVRQLAAEFRNMHAYTVAFGVEAGEYRVAGEYAVDGARYNLKMDAAEVYSEGDIRYEVDRRRREVTIAPVDTTSRNLLDNPVRAFDFLDEAYRPELVREDRGRAVVRLVPSGADAATGEIVVTLTTAPVRPAELVYDFGGERVTIGVTRIAPLSGTLPHFDPTAFPGFETIDFR